VTIRLPFTTILKAIMCPLRNSCARRCFWQRAPVGKAVHQRATLTLTLRVSPSDDFVYARAITIFRPMSDRCSVPTPDIVQTWRASVRPTTWQTRDDAALGVATRQRWSVLRSSRFAPNGVPAPFGVRLRTNELDGRKDPSLWRPTYELRRYGRCLGAANKAISMSSRPNWGLNRRPADSFSPTVSSAPRAAASAASE
jgi:hypothetical protein